MFERLTRREQEVLDLVAKGLRNKQIAQHLVISARTVDFHVSRILLKFQVDSRHQLIETIRRGGTPMRSSRRS